MQWWVTWEMRSNFLHKNHAEAHVCCMAAVCMPVHCCNFSDSILLTPEILTMMITLTYLLMLRFLFTLHSAFYILPILFGTFDCPCPPLPIKSHSFKSSGILKVLEAKQANQIQNDIRILKSGSLIPHDDLKKTSLSFIRSNQLLRAWQLQSKTETLALQYVEHDAKW